jgi:O-antigen/teichoic acid export membrane protein
MPSAPASDIPSDRRAPRNVAFNFVGRVGTSLITFLFIPVFINILDTESWGIVAFAISLSAISLIFDFGFGATLNRELARKSTTAEAEAQRADLLYSLDIPFIALGLLVAVVIWMLAGPIAEQWLEFETLDTAEVMLCFQLAAGSVGLQMLCGFYSGGLLGLQLQFSANLARLLYGIALYGGGCALLMLLPGGSVSSFFAWQLFVAIVYCLGLRAALYRAVRIEGGKPALRFAYILENYRYSLGIAGTTVLVVCLTQLDKMMLSKLLNLSDFGVYMIAVSVTSLQVIMVQPVQVAVFPQFSALYGDRDMAGLGSKFLFWSGWVALMIFPVGAGIILFAEELAIIWLRDAAIAEQVALPLAILAAGSMLNAVCTLPYTAQLAAGWPSLGFYANLVALIFMVPALVLLTQTYGQVGAATVWLLLNLGYVTIQVPIMFTRLLKPQRRQWLRQSFLQPCLISFLVVGAFKFFTQGLELSQVLNLAVVICAVLLSAGLSYVLQDSTDGR